VRETWRR